MDEPQKKPKVDLTDTLFNATMAVVLGQVGFLTLVIILAAIGIGLWLDQRFETRPLVTLVLVLCSIPASLVFTVRIVKRAVSRHAKKSDSDEKDHELE